VRACTHCAVLAWDWCVQTNACPATGAIALQRGVCRRLRWSLYGWSDRSPHNLAEGRARPRVGAATVGLGALWCSPSHRGSAHRRRRCALPWGRSGAARRACALDSRPKGGLSQGRLKAYRVAWVKPMPDRSSCAVQENIPDFTPPSGCCQVLARLHFASVLKNIATGRLLS
jgi:hypothetical protein